MPTIDPTLVPTISPGNMFYRFTEDTTLNIRWITSKDPVYFEVYNRPMADITLRQLIIAKAIDNISLRLAFLSIFPFLVPPKLNAGSGSIDLPMSWIWDMSASIPSKWEYLRLTKIKRISGTNTQTTGTSGGTYTGSVRLIFAAQAKGSANETSLFYVDYKIDSTLTYQILRVQVVSSTEESDAVDAGEAGTIDGFVIFRTLDTSDSDIGAFFSTLEPPVVPVYNPDSTYANPNVYEILDDSTDTYVIVAMPHGSGMLVVNASNPIPDANSDFNSWLSSSNYPFRINMSKTSVSGIEVPSALFREFNILAPSPDEPTDDISKLNSPVWLSTIERVDTLANQLKFVFSTYTIGGSGTPQIVEFASMILERDYLSGRVVAIEPITNLLKDETSSSDNYLQGFGTGYVVLSSLWGATTDEISNFFDEFLAIVDVPAVATYAKESALLSSFAISRIPRYVPTVGQSAALVGSGARFTPARPPTDSDRYVTEGDTGLGDAVDFRTLDGFPEDLRENTDIEPIGYSGTSVHKLVKLVVSANGTSHNYDTDVLPRLKCLFGRDPIFGDEWWDGTYFKKYNGDAWITM